MFNRNMEQYDKYCDDYEDIDTEICNIEKYEIDSNTSLKNNKHENSLTKTMKHFKLTVMTCHHLYISHQMC